MSDFAPYTLLDDTGTELLVLDETFTVLTDIGDGQRTVFGETRSWPLARAWRDCLAHDGIAATIEVDHDTVDLADMWRQWRHRETTA
jgi:hypothetical protein